MNDKEPVSEATPPERIWIDLTCHAQDVAANRAGAYFTTPSTDDPDCVEYVRADSKRVAELEARIKELEAETKG